MEEITFTDILTHYQIKLREAIDEIERIRSDMNHAEERIETGWSGEAAEACRFKIHEIDRQASKALDDLSDALVKLSSIDEILI